VTASTSNEMLMVRPVFDAPGLWMTLPVAQHLIPRVSDQWCDRNHRSSTPRSELLPGLE
jgi:hypothetical protein